MAQSTNNDTTATNDNNNVGLSNFKSICIIIVVVGCFAVLWPKIFYPMLMFGLKFDYGEKLWFGSGGQTSNNEPNLSLPPRVREAMRSSPIVSSKNIHKLAGRPQFYTGKREINPSSSQNSIWNVLVPLYSLVLVIIFLYALFKLTLKSDRNGVGRGNRPSQQPQYSDDCKECQYDKLRKEYTNRRYDPYLSRSTYRTFDYYGRQNVTNVMRSLVDDVRTFREHLIKAEICRCKLEKYQKEINEAENFLNKNNQEEEVVAETTIGDNNIVNDDNNENNENSNNQDSMVTEIIKEEMAQEGEENENNSNQKLMNDNDNSEDTTVAVAADGIGTEDYNNEQIESENIIQEKENIIDLIDESSSSSLTTLKPNKTRKRYLNMKILKDRMNHNRIIEKMKLDKNPFDSKFVKRINEKFDKFLNNHHH